MIAFISSIIADYFYKKRIITKEYIDICAYGYEVIIFNLFNALLIILLGILLDRFILSMIFFLIFAVLRQYSGGFHAKNTVVCTITYLLSYAFVMFISECKYIPYFYTIPSCIVLNVTIVGVMLAYAPIENKNKKLEQSDKKKYKRISVIISSFLALVSIFTYHINIHVSAIISLTVCVVVMMMFVGAYKEKEGKHEENTEYDG